MNDKQAYVLAAKLADEIKQRDSFVMQAQVTSPFRIHVLSFALKASSIKTTSSFIVYLHQSMSIEEIRRRMHKGFGDAKH